MIYLFFNYFFNLFRSFAHVYNLSLHAGIGSFEEQSAGAAYTSLAELTMYYIHHISPLMLLLMPLARIFGGILNLEDLIEVRLCDQTVDDDRFQESS